MINFTYKYISLQLLLYCLETQFDLVIVDRPMVLQSIYQLHNTLSDRKILSWEFFLNRFEALFLEAQINSNKTLDFANLRGKVVFYCVTSAANFMLFSLA